MPGLINSSQGINLTYLNLLPPGVPLVTYLQRPVQLDAGCLFQRHQSHDNWRTPIRVCG